MATSTYSCDECGETFDEVAVYRGHLSGHAREYTKAEMIEHGQELAGELGRAPTQAEMGDYDGPSATVCQDHFGSWNSYLDACGLEPHHRKDWTREKLIAEMRRVSGIVDRTPSVADLKKHGRCSHQPFLTEFDKLSVAHEAAGLEPNSFEEPPRMLQATEEDQLIEAMHDAVDELGRPPTAKEMADIGRFTPDPYQRVFGTWSNGIAAAGYDPMYNRSGERHGRWKGGQFDYGDNWTFTFKEKIREHHDRLCQGCGKPGEQNRAEVGGRLQVHHVINARKFDDEDRRNDPSNLVPLCHECHPKWDKIELKPLLI